MSGISNEELVQKAIITADSLATAGKLNTAQSDKFIDYVVDQTVLKNNARIVRFTNESLDIDKIGIGRRAAMPKAEAVDPGLRRGINTSKVTLTPREIMVPVEIGDTFREVNIEGESVEDTIMRMFATQMANDMEELYINGDVLGPSITENDYKGAGSNTDYIKDAYLALQNGWFRLADSGNIVDHANTAIGLTAFGKMLRAMPTKFRRNKAALRWFMSPDMYQLYMEQIASRDTGLGDAVAGGSMHNPFGVPAVELPLLDQLVSVTEHIQLNGVAVTPMRYKPVGNVVVLPSTLADAPTTPFVSGVNYTLDAPNGTIARIAVAGIGDGDIVKVTYSANPQILLTHQNNFIVGIGRDVRIEKDRDIFKGVNQYAITAKVSVQFEEAEAIVKGVNLKTTL
jgi:hypothetical protein